MDFKYLIRQRCLGDYICLKPMRPAWYRRHEEPLIGIEKVSDGLLFEPLDELAIGVPLRNKLVK
ncbi:hypothetical protein C485_07932 [Natrinema altunense JCM 12890]|uniref:Uncharacterized protein n=1 Tax=Natrinema altunense (strain JCM 12890 / CGMCC 1.3731 / AJ2) TaxID=1227494 RepID=L9ZKE0_NATA2|nr:hypothetical protein C485_07932 [Natrinema altunense JCM 12890]